MGDEPSESFEDLLARGEALYAQERYAESLPFFERATHLVLDNVDVWFKLRYVRTMLEQWQEALRAYEQALRIKPDDAMAWNNKGSTLGKLERYEEALVAYERTLALDPQLASAWCNRGGALRGLKTAGGGGNSLRPGSGIGPDGRGGEAQQRQRAARTCPQSTCASVRESGT